MTYLVLSLWLLFGYTASRLWAKDFNGITVGELILCFIVGPILSIILGGSRMLSDDSNPNQVKFWKNK